MWKKELEVVPECNDEYAIESSDGINLCGKIYRTLSGARKKAEEIACRQSKRGLFTD